MLFNVTYQVANESQAQVIAGLPDQAMLSVIAMNCYTRGCTASVTSVDGTFVGSVDKKGNVTWIAP